MGTLRGRGFHSVETLRGRVFHVAGVYTCVEELIANKSGGNVYVDITVNGKEVLAILDTGSARTLLDQLTFPPETLCGYQTAKPNHEGLVDASGNNVPTIGRWPAIVRAGRLSGCIAADVTRGCPAPAIIGLDVLREMRAVIVFSETGIDV